MGCGDGNFQNTSGKQTYPIVYTEVGPKISQLCNPCNPDSIPSYPSILFVYIQESVKIIPWVSGPLDRSKP